MDFLAKLTKKKQKNKEIKKKTKRKRRKKEINKKQKKNANFPV